MKQEEQWLFYQNRESSSILPGFPCLIAVRITADMIAYNMENNEPGWWIDSLAQLCTPEDHAPVPGHDGSSEPQNGSWSDDPVFITVQDALQVLPRREEV